jgi:polysaccharide biosynthesis protein PslH
MNVLSIVSYNILPAKMGGQKGIALFNEWLAKKVNLFCFTTKSNNPSLANYKVYNHLSNHTSRYFNIFIYFEIKKVIKNNQISHVIIEHPYYAWLGYLLKKTCGVKLIIHSHNIESTRFKSLGKVWWKLLWHYERWIHRGADMNFFINENDRQYALKHFSLMEAKTIVITYGFDLKEIPNESQKQVAANTIRKSNGIDKEEKILLFNGTLNYKANLNALDIILQQINPLLLQTSFKYKIIVCGKDLPDTYNHLKAYPNVIYAGFVEDIIQYYLATDIFINPVNDGGGIKTKIVEALGFNVSLVTTASGAMGIPENIVGGKMIVIEDNDWNGFANAITTINTNTPLPNAYFDHFYWGSIVDKAFKAIATC